MALTFEDFTQQIAPEILRRGRDYQRDGYIAELTMGEDGVWVALVAGTEDYDVEVELLEDGTLACSCTCPFDGGPYCKHIAAVLFAIQEMYPQDISKKKAKAGAAARQSKGSRLRAVLQQASHEDLVTALMELAARDSQTANQLALRFGAVENDRASYEKLVNDAIHAHVNRGFLDYRGTIAAASAVGDLLGRAQQLMAQGAFDAAITFYQVVIERVVEALGSADDSNGSLGGCVANATMALEKAADTASPPQRAALFDLSLKEAQLPRMEGWDWRWDLFRLAAELIDTPEQREKLFAVLESIKPKRFGAGALPARSGDDLDINSLASTFDVEQAGMIQLSVIEREDGEQVAETFIAERIHLNRFRELYIDRLLKRGDLGGVKRLAQEAVGRYENSRWQGIVTTYQRILLDVAQRENDTASIITLARALLPDPRGQQEQYYKLLKTHVDPAAWKEFVEAVLKDAEARRDERLIAWLCAQEGMWSKILDRAKKGWSYAVETYRGELERHFPDDVAEIYEQAARNMLKPTTNRETYHAACEYLRRMKAIGKSERVRVVVADLKARYRQRRALQAELDDV